MNKTEVSFYHQYSSAIIALVFIGGIFLIGIMAHYYQYSGPVISTVKATLYTKQWTSGRSTTSASFRFNDGKIVSGICSEDIGDRTGMILFVEQKTAMLYGDFVYECVRK